MLQTYARVVSNKGAAGVDGLGVERLHHHIKANRISIRSQIEASTYIPQAVRKVEIPKPNGGTRMLGIPTVTDRLIQQGIAQVLSQYYDSCLLGGRKTKQEETYFVFLLLDLIQK